MDYRPLGRTGMKGVDEVDPRVECFVDDADGVLVLGVADGGGEHQRAERVRADADAYGDSEEVVGKALKGRRDDVVLATKVSRPMGDGPNRQGASRRWIVAEVENSLRRLQTDYLDLYQIQRPDPDTDIEQTLSALSDLIHSGKVRAIGSSTMPASDIVEAHWVAERRGLERFHTEQPPYSILNRSVEREVLPTAQRYGMGILVWGPLGQGMLTGRVRKVQQTDLVRAGLFKASATNAGSRPSSDSSHSPGRRTCR